MGDNPLAALMGAAVAEVEAESTNEDRKPTVVVGSMLAADDGGSDDEGDLEGNVREPQHDGAPSNNPFDLEAAEYGVVQLNPEAVRLGLTKPSKPQRPSTAPARQSTAVPPPARAQQPILSPKQEQRQAAAFNMRVLGVDKQAQRPAVPLGDTDEGSKDDFFGISYKKMRVPGEDKGYDLPSGPAFEDEKEFEAELATSELGKAAAGVDDDDEFDDEFDAIEISSAPVIAKAVAAAPSASSNPFDAVPTPPQGEAVSLNPFDAVPADGTSGAAAARREARELGERRVVEEMRAEAERLTAAAAVTTTGSVAPTRAAAPDVLLKMHAQYAAGLTDDEAAKKRALDAAEFARAVDVKAPLGSLCEEGEEGEEGEGGSGGFSPTVSTTAKAPDAALETVQRQWDNLKTVPQQPSQGKNGSQGSGSRQLISHANAIKYFHTAAAGLERNRDSIVTSVKGAKKGGFFKRSPPKLAFERAEEKRDFVFLLAAAKFDGVQTAHLRVLQTIYKRLTGDERDCPRFGSHWEQIGFQGNDPATDLRGVGMLGLTQMLYFIEHHGALARKIHSLSRDKVQRFPFMAVSMNLTLATLQALRAGCLNAACNKAKRVLEECNLLFMALFYAMYARWHREGCTIEHFGPVLDDLKTEATKTPEKLVAKLKAVLYAPVTGGLGTAGDDFSSFDKKARPGTA